MPTPGPVEFRSLKQLLRRLHANRETESNSIGVRVPIDGRPRQSAIKRFFGGHICVPGPSSHGDRIARKEMHFAGE